MYKFFKISCLVASLLPLWFCIIIRYTIEFLAGTISWRWNDFIPYIFIFVLLSLFISLLANVHSICLIRAKSKENNNRETYKIKDINKKDNYTLDFLLSFIIPFLGFYSNGDSVERLIGVITSLIYIVIIFLIKSKNNQVFTNVFLEILSFKFYSISVGDNESNEIKIDNALLITNRKLVKKGDIIDVFQIQNDTFIL